MTKIILILAIAVLAVGVQSAYAGAVGKSCENAEHWNKILFELSFTNFVHDSLPDITQSEVPYEVLVQVDPNAVHQPEQLVANKLNDLGYSLSGGGSIPADEICCTEVTYSSFCADGNDFMTVVGGMLLQPDSATLLIAYGIANSIWIVPSVAGIGIAVYLVKRRF